MLNVVAMFVIGQALAEAGPMPVQEEASSPASAAMATNLLGEADTPARRHQDIFEFGIAALLQGFAALRS